MNTTHFLMVPNAAADGFTHTTEADNCQASGCPTLSLAAQDTFIFNDPIHFTTAFNQVLASVAAEAVNRNEPTAAPVPEPASMALAISGLIGLALVRLYRSGRRCAGLVTAPARETP